MSRLVIFQTGFSGVDLKSNPLILGEKKKLRVTTNMVFEEGVLRTRPGFRYEPLADAGQFQGACSFKPSKGISSESFSTHDSGVALIIAGTLWFNCRRISPELYPCGNVNLFGAENYLILQNTCSETYWWDGETLSESPGLNDESWHDEDTPTIELELVPPSEPDLTPCEDGIASILFTVVNHFTEERLTNAGVRLNKNGHKAYQGATNDRGQVTIIPFPRTYQYFGFASGFTRSVDANLTVIKGVDRSITVRLVPTLLPFNIHAFLSVPQSGETPGRYDLSAFFGPEIVPPKNAFRTKWRLFTDICGYQIKYFEGDMDNNGALLTTGDNNSYISTSAAHFDQDTMEFVSTYPHPEGLYLQLGVVIDGVLEWSSRPCIEGGDP